MSKHEGSYRQRRGQTNDTDPLVSGQRRSEKESRACAFQASTIAIVFSGIAPLVALAVWLAHTAAQPAVFKTFAGAHIGGRLSQGQAKALDVVCGALIAPLLMAALNMVWFASAHVSVVNEQARNGRGVPLDSLVAVSSTYSGSYDLFNLYALIRGRTWRLFLFASLTILSAVARSSLCNVIAYEAYHEDRDSPETFALRSLRDATIDRESPPIATDPIGRYKYTQSQQADITGQISALLTGLNFRDASPLLADGGAYIGTNATGSSMDSLQPSIVRLEDVPGYRLMPECKPARSTNLNVLQSGGLSTRITALWSAGDNQTPDQSTQMQEEGMLLSADFPGVIAGMQGAYNDYYAFVGFSMNKSEAVLAYMTSFNYTQHVIPSPYGGVRPDAFNMTSSGFSGTKQVMTVWGLRCTLLRQDGYLNYSRNDGQQWKISGSYFRPEKQRVPSFLGDWQLALNYNAPGAVIPGLGPPLAETAGVPCEGPGCSRPLSFEIYARNYLYASAIVQQIVYNVAAKDPARDQPEYFYSVRGGVEEEYYRITYVPIILLVGLLSLIAAAAITIAMLTYASRTVSGRTFRKVDVLRLVFDGVLGLWSDTPALTKMKEDNAALRDWAKAYYVSYSEEEENGRRVVRLSNQGDAGE